jgi:hypothetical protein
LIRLEHRDVVDWVYHSHGLGETEGEGIGAGLKKIRLGTPELDTRVSGAMVEAMRAMEAILGRVAESSVRGALANEKLARAIDRLAVVVAESAANTLSIGKGLRELAEAGREKEVAESKGKGKEKKEESTDSGETAESGCGDTGGGSGGFAGEKDGGSGGSGGVGGKYG